jgi:small subunit ribosomal protein S3
MGQKVIPTSLRLNKNKNWHSKWIVKKNEYPNLLHFDLEIRKYFENIFNYKHLKLIKINIIKNSNNIYIYVYTIQQIKNFYKLAINKLLYNLNFLYPHHNIKIFIKNIKLNNLKKLELNIKKIFKFINKNKKINKQIKKLIYNFSYAFYTKNIHIITFYIRENLQRKKNHKKFIININKTMEQFFQIFSNFYGYRLQFKGRLNGSKRKKKLIFQKGKIPLNSLKYNIQYHFNEFKTPSGICSIKFWVFLKKIN